MTDVLLARASDSPGYITLLLADPVGQAAAGDTVTAETPDGDVTLVLHGQRELDVPDTATRVQFPDGAEWKPSKKS